MRPPYISTSFLPFRQSGDLSGKYGMLTNRSEVQRVSNDTNLQLFGPETVLGRSVVIHRAADGSR